VAIGRPGQQDGFMSDIESPGSDGYRIGDSDRQAATDALNVHREAGRLDAVEYEDRQVRIAQARTWTQIQPLFDDLPAPHPVGMPPSGAAPSPLRPMAGAPPAPVPVEQQSGLLGDLVPQRYRSTVMALSPFIALLLFFSTHWWVWFLLIPVLGILLYGPEGKDERHRERDRQRALERQARRERRGRL
jgi:Domain of unknown function (DUF1707)